MIPDGYTAHGGVICPVAPDTYVDCIIRTGEGLGHSGACRADLHDWSLEGMGAVVAYRLAQMGEEIDLYARWAE